MKHIDENYFKNSSNSMANNIRDVISHDEQILWQGKPKKKAFIISSILKMMPIALIWLLFDGIFIISFLNNGVGESATTEISIFIIVFFIFHLTPVWIWLGNILTANRQHKNLEYVFTNKRIIIKSGIIGIDFQNIYYSDIVSVNLKVGLADKLLKVGDIYINCKTGAKVLFDIEDPYFITSKLQKIVVDIKTDIEYPIELRPDENRGYNTRYKD